ncbi:MAG TPA: hypothetical protein VK900_04615 [Anaerolineales bacterium]|nr:hypothetical protein [Anaerolineales bacterium]
MSPDSIIFAGVELSSGRKPVTFAALNEDLKVTRMEQWSVSEARVCLNDLGSLWLAMSMAPVDRPIEQDFRKKAVEADFALYPARGDSKQLLMTNAHDCFQALIGQKPLSRRSLEGRLQRSAILYEQGLQIKDPIDVFEEITRFKLMQGILPLEDVPSPKELDALAVAYVAWLAVNRPGQIVLRGGFVLPAQE